MTVPRPTALLPSDAHWPRLLSGLLGEATPATLWAIGPIELLDEERTAFFCSAQTPGEIILRAHDAARRLREEGRTVVSGFQSAIERDCLRILLRGDQPLVICPARAIGTLRLPRECRAAFEAGRILYLSPFTERPKRVTRDSAARRNEVVAALADRACIPYAAAGGETARIAALLKQWRVPVNAAP